MVFRQLVEADVAKILDLEIKKVQARLAARNKKLRLSRPARQFLVEKGFDRTLGARPLRRAIEQYVEDPLSEEILRGNLETAEMIEVIVSDNCLRFRAANPTDKE